MWKDRAAGAIGAGRELRLRDLRAVVTSAKTVSLDDEARVQLKELQIVTDGARRAPAHAVEREARGGDRGEEREGGARRSWRVRPTCRRASAPTRRLAS